MLTHGRLTENHSIGHDWRLVRFPHLMPRRIERILLVSSAYDSFILEEDGLLTELIFSEYTDLGLTHAPSVTRVSTGEEAFEELRRHPYDLIITMLRLVDMDLKRFGREARQINSIAPIVLMVSNVAELARLDDRREDLGCDAIYVWHGDAKIFLAIIKVMEDRWNVEHDTREGGVGVIILVEDSVRYRSSILPIMYSELVNQTRSVMLDGINRMHRQLRLRARPKILVAETFEEGMQLYQKFREYIFGVVSDVAFVRDGAPDPEAGIRFIRELKQDNPDLSALLQSSDLSNREKARELQTSFLHKRSTSLLHDVREFMLANFGFGDFVFRMPEGREVARASDLRDMARVLRDVPAESLAHHARRNHFSIWLRARTEFVLARKLRPKKITEFGDVEGLRRYLISELEDVLRRNRRGVVEDFDAGKFDLHTSFARVGGGSLGGKARGLAFMDAMLMRHQVDRAFEGVRVYVPRTVVVGTDVFEEFLDGNHLRSQGLYTAKDEWIRSAFLKAELSSEVVEALRAYLNISRYPIAVRSSSLLEDSQTHPFAGVYDTYMIPNNHPDDRVRLDQLCDAIKLVFASTFYSAARKYLESTPHRIEEQQMAVILQQIVGTRHESHFYPNFAGVMRSYNFYPFGHMRPEDGVASVGLGLGRLVVEGGEALRFCPAYPQVLPQLSSPRQFLATSQRGFYALDLSRTEFDVAGDPNAAVARLPLEQAERDGTLALIGSVWSPENQCFYDGISRPGPRAVTFAHVLKSDVFPLAPIIHRVLELGRSGLSGPVEMEFAVNLASEPKEFAILQMRPYGVGGDFEPVDIAEIPDEMLCCSSPQSLGNGVIAGIADVVYVIPETFDPMRTREIAREVAEFNERLRASGHSYLLIGPGRWGSSNHSLGIPVTWAQICAARIIVETSLSNFSVDPSQGSHFFHNLTSLGTAYMTINPKLKQGFVDWAWLAEQPVAAEGAFVRHVLLEIPVEARIDGRTSRGVVLKWSARETPM
ncbi:MAG: histidine kinase [Planctomycetes bacterium]|nr:histidine kinase [Planctomycetota bacterium]